MYTRYSFKMISHFPFLPSFPSSLPPSLASVRPSFLPSFRVDRGSLMFQALAKCWETVCVFKEVTIQWRGGRAACFSK